MRYSASVSALALATAVLAQDQTIHVGNDGNGHKGLLFTPNSVTASNGTVITFVFDTPNTNHTVAQSTFANPCEPAPDGFDSGYTPGPANAGDPPATWNLTITNDAKPIWFYCAQEAAKPFHCTAGMVGAINAPPSPAPNDFAAFSSAAVGASTIVQPTAALTGLGAFASAAPTIFVSNATATDSTSASTSASTSTSTTTSDSTSVTDSDSPSSTSDSATPAPPPTTQAPPPTTAPPAPTTNTNTNTNDAVTTMTVLPTSSAASNGTSNAAAGPVGKSGFAWAVAAAFGVALL